ARVVRDDADTLAELQALAVTEPDEAVLLAEAPDARPRCLEHEPEAVSRTRVVGQSLAAGVDDREVRLGSRDDRGVDGQRDVVERRGSGGDRRAIVERVGAGAVL